MTSLSALERLLSRGFKMYFSLLLLVTLLSNTSVNTSHLLISAPSVLCVNSLKHVLLMKTITWKTHISRFIWGQQLSNVCTRMGAKYYSLNASFFFFYLERVTCIGWSARANSCVSATYVWLQGKKEIVAHKTHFWAPFQADLSLSVKHSDLQHQPILTWTTIVYFSSLLQTSESSQRAENTFCGMFLVDWFSEAKIKKTDWIQMLFQWIHCQLSKLEGNAEFF